MRICGPWREGFVLENRASQHHRERLVEAIKDEITTILTGELADPRIGLVTVSQIVMAPAGKAARVYITVQGTEEEAKQSIEGLRDAVGYIRHKLAEALKLRRAPEITFHLDNSDQYSSRIDELLHRVDKQERKNKRK
jgi:ribosome-binding factor A